MERKFQVEEPQWKQDSNMWLNLLEQQLYQQAQTAKLLIVFANDEQTAKEILASFVSGIHWMFKYFDKTTKLAYADFAAPDSNPEAPNPQDRFAQLMAEAQKARKYELRMRELKSSVKATMRPIDFKEKQRRQKRTVGPLKRWSEEDSRDLLQKLQSVVSDGKRRASLRQIYDEVEGLYQGQRTAHGCQMHITQLRRTKAYGGSLLPSEEELLEYIDKRFRLDVFQGLKREQEAKPVTEAGKVNTQELA